MIIEVPPLMGTLGCKRFSPGSSTNNLAFFSSQEMQTQLNVHLRRWCDGGETCKSPPESIYTVEWKEKKHTHVTSFLPKKQSQSVIRSLRHVMATSAFINSSHIHFWGKAVQQSLKVFAFKGFEHIWPFCDGRIFTPTSVDARNSCPVIRLDNMFLPFISH